MYLKKFHFCVYEFCLSHRVETFKETLKKNKSLGSFVIVLQLQYCEYYIFLHPLFRELQLSILTAHTCTHGTYIRW